MPKKKSRAGKAVTYKEFKKQTGGYEGSTDAWDKWHKGMKTKGGHAPAVADPITGKPLKGDRPKGYPQHYGWKRGEEPRMQSPEQFMMESGGGAAGIARSVGKKAAKTLSKAALLRQQAAKKLTPKIKPKKYEMGGYRKGAARRTEISESRKLQQAIEVRTKAGKKLQGGKGTPAQKEAWKTANARVETIERQMGRKVKPTTRAPDTGPAPKGGKAKWARHRKSGKKSGIKFEGDKRTVSWKTGKPWKAAEESVTTTKPRVPRTTTPGEKAFYTRKMKTRALATVPKKIAAKAAPRRTEGVRVGGTPVKSPARRSEGGTYKGEGPAPGRVVDPGAPVKKAAPKRTLKSDARRRAKSRGTKIRDFQLKAEAAKARQTATRTRVGGGPRPKAPSAAPSTPAERAAQAVADKRRLQASKLRDRPPLDDLAQRRSTVTKTAKPKATAKPKKKAKPKAAKPKKKAKSVEESPGDLEHGDEWHNAWKRNLADIHTPAFPKPPRGYGD